MDMNNQRVPSRFDTEEPTFDNRPDPSDAAAYLDWVRARARARSKERAARLMSDPATAAIERERRRLRAMEARHRRTAGIPPVPRGQRVPKEQ
ncbi:hypothetical protein DVG80_04115 [Rhodococcus erythropolis]|nr:hypothetical protein DVG80_04115 [Rhodococcus erythropolis]